LHVAGCGCCNIQIHTHTYTHKHTHAHRQIDKQPASWVTLERTLTGVDDIIDSN